MNQSANWRRMPSVSINDHTFSIRFARSGRRRAPRRNAPAVHIDTEKPPPQGAVELDSTGYLIRADDEQLNAAMQAGDVPDAIGE